jgi:hypothetical protein
MIVPVMRPRPANSLVRDAMLNPMLSTAGFGQGPPHAVAESQPSPELPAGLEAPKGGPATASRKRGSRGSQGRRDVAADRDAVTAAPASSLPLDLPSPRPTIRIRP